MAEIVRMVVVLTSISAICAGALAFANQQLGPRIEEQTDFYVRGPALERLFGRPAEDVLDHKVTLEVDGVVFPVFFIKEDREVTALAVEAIGQGGYGGDLQLMVGIDLEAGRLIGMEIVSHSETPGLGARVEEISFRRQWQGLEADRPVALRTQGGRIDAISGATITSNASVNGTNEVVRFVSENEDRILAAISDHEGAS